MKILAIIPTDATLDYLKDCFQATNVEIDWDNVYVEICSTDKQIELRPNKVYQFNAGSMGYWYDDDAGHSNIILPLIPGDDAISRFKEVGDIWKRHFVPHMVLTDKFNNKRRTKARINSIATGLIEVQPILEFYSEMWIELSEPQRQRPRQHAFYQDYLARGQVTNVVYIDEERN